MQILKQAIKNLKQTTTTTPPPNADEGKGGGYKTHADSQIKHELPMQRD